MKEDKCSLRLLKCIESLLWKKLYDIQEIAAALNMNTHCVEKCSTNRIRLESISQTLKQSGKTIS